MLMCGPSGCGKTNTLMHMIYNLLYFDKIYLYSRAAKISGTGNLDMGDHKMSNLETPTDGNDGATKKYVDDQIHLQTNKIFDKRTDSYVLHPNFGYFMRAGFRGELPYADLIIPSSQEDSFIKDHQQGKVYRVNMNVTDDQFHITYFFYLIMI